jgi:hypothetical protein
MASASGAQGPPRTHASAQLVAALGPHFPLYVVGGGGAVVGAMLLLSARAARRGARCAGVIDAAERVVLRDARVLRALGGHVLAGGSYQVAAEDLQASGWFSASAPGGARARVVLAASRARARDEWAFSHLQLEVDRRAFAARAAERRAVAVAAGRAAASDPPPPEPVGDAALDNEDAIVFLLRPEAAAPAAAAAAASPPAAATANALR